MALIILIFDVVTELQILIIINCFNTERNTRAVCVCRPLLNYIGDVVVAVSGDVPGVVVPASGVVVPGVVVVSVIPGVVVSVPVESTIALSELDCDSRLAEHAVRPSPAASVNIKIFVFMAVFR